MNRLQNGLGTQTITGSQLERDLRNAPAVSIGYTGKKYPHKYQNIDKPPLLRRGSFYEFPVGNYPFHLQNAKGNAMVIDASRNRVKADKGYMRIVTDRYKNIKALIYHPYSHLGPVNSFLRAAEIVHWREWLGSLAQWPRNIIINMWRTVQAWIGAVLV